VQTQTRFVLSSVGIAHACPQHGLLCKNQAFARFECAKGLGNCAFSHLEVLTSR